MGRGLVPHLLEEAALGGALLALRGFKGVVLELLLVPLAEGFDLLVRGRCVSGDLFVVAVMVVDMGMLLLLLLVLLVVVEVLIC